MTENNFTGNRTGTLVFLLLFVFFSCFFLLFTGPVKDGDFFWHAATGRWIAEHGTLPERDPFSSADNLTGSAPGASFILKGYWLGQLLLYWIWDNLGAAGIVLLRAGVYTSILLFIFVWTRKESTAVVSLTVTTLLGKLLEYFPNERPQLLTFLLFPVALSLLDRLQSQRGAGRGPGHLLLPALMLLWANLHGGYVLGVGLILLYLFGTSIDSLRGRLTPAAPFVAACLSALVITFLNPNSYGALTYLWQTDLSRSESIQEFISPFVFACRLREYYLPYFIAFFSILVVVILNVRKIGLSRLLVILLIGGLSATGLRYMPYLLMAAPLVTMHIRLRVKEIYPAVAAALLMLVNVVAARDRIAEFRIDPSFPEGAVAFLSAQEPQGKIFNFYDWGGYLIERIPGHQRFIDGRGLSGAIDAEYESAMWTDRWEEVLERHRCDLVLLPGMSPESGEIFPLAFSMMSAPDWSLVYRDDRSLLFARDTDEDQSIRKRASMNKVLMFDQIISEATYLISSHPDNASFWRSRAIARWYRGNFAESVEDFRKVLELSPGDPRALSVINGPAIPPP